MTHRELLAKRIETQHGMFRPVYTYSEEQPIYDKDGNIVDYELVGYIETMTAEQNYEAWLSGRDIPPQQNEYEILEEKVLVLEQEKQALEQRVLFTEDVLMELLVANMSL